MLFLFLSAVPHPKRQGLFRVALGQEIHSPGTGQSPWLSQLLALRDSGVPARLGWGAP